MAYFRRLSLTEMCIVFCRKLYLTSVYNIQHLLPNILNEQSRRQFSYLLAKRQHPPCAFQRLKNSNKQPFNAVIHSTGVIRPPLR